MEDYIVDIKLSDFNVICDIMEQEQLTINSSLNCHFEAFIFQV